MTYQGITATMGGQRDLGVKSKLTRNPTPNSQHVPSGSPYPPQSFEFFQVSPERIDMFEIALMGVMLVTMILSLRYGKLQIPLRLYQSSFMIQLP